MLSQAEIAQVLTCPECDAQLTLLSECGACGTAYKAESKGGRTVPFLVAKNRSRTVSFKVTTESTNPRNVDFSTFFKYPARFGKMVDGGPYHLDQAHADRLLRLPKGSLVLEIGCGGAQARSWMENTGLRYLGTDIAFDRVFDWLQEHGGPDIICDAHFMPVRSDSVDVVYATAVMEHVANPFCTVQEFYRVLKPGGLLLSNASFLEPWHDSSYFHLSPLGSHELLRQAGFEIDCMWPQPDYLGYYSLMMMGNKGTQIVSAVGRAISAWYKASFRLRDLVKGRGFQSKEALILDHANLSGAYTWIAHKPEVVLA